MARDVKKEASEIVHKLAQLSVESAKLEADLRELRGLCQHAAGEAKSGYVYCDNCQIALRMV